jgi:hypothetical protein
MAGPDESSVFQSAFQSPEDEFNTNLGVRPFVFDILGPDMETSVLPVNLRMVLHAPPQSVSISYTKQIERIQTRGGFVEQHWGEGARTMDFSMVTGGFMRLFSGLSNVTGGPGAEDTGGSRRESISYDKYLDLLALFHNNGSVYDASGKIVFQGVIQVTFDGGIYNGWWSDFKVSEDSSRPYLFSLTANFTIDKEIQRFRTPLPAGGF